MNNPLSGELSGADQFSLFINNLFTIFFVGHCLHSGQRAVEAVTVIASGAWPVIMGILIDHHVSLRAQVLVCMTFIITASLVATRIKT